MEKVEITIIGAGVVGLAIAYQLAKAGHSVLLLEQHQSFGHETSSRNSEVIHAGIYYPTNSLKAVLCVEGKHLLYEYGQAHQIPHQNLGKLIVAVEKAEETTLEGILEKAKNNGVDDLTWISQKALKSMEPALRATQALHSPSTGIVDSHSLMRSLLGHAEQYGTWVAFDTQIQTIIPNANGFELHTLSAGEPFSLATHLLINAAGLSAQSVSKQIQGFPQQHIPPLYLCKGNYFVMNGKNPFQRLIYPVPEANTRGLGIHATIDMAGQLRFGPDTEYIDAVDYQVSVNNIDRYYQIIRRYFPALQDDSLTPGYVGIRPKLQGPQDAFKDFVIQTEKDHGISGLIQLYGIESPGLTASLAIAKYVQRSL